MSSGVPELRALDVLLRPVLDADVQSFDFVARHLVPPGENYGGIILSLDVHLTKQDGSERTVHLVAKLGPPNEMLRVMFNIQFTFKREMDTYVDVIPALVSLQREHNIPADKVLDLFPRCYGARLNLHGRTDVLDTDGLMVFENLQTQGFTMQDRMVGFGLDDSRLFLAQLARFHALPIALRLLKPAVFQAKIAGLQPASFGDSFTDEMKRGFLVTLTDVISGLEGCKPYAGKVVQLVDRGFKFEERFLAPTAPFATTVHHDLWANNVMVRRQADGKATHVKLYDLQMLCYGSLAHDLLFFLYSSVQQDTFAAHYEHLIKIYYDSFIGCLREFRLDTGEFSWDRFRAELNEIGPHQISHIIIMLRPIFMEKGRVQDNADMDGSEMAKLHTLNSGYKVKMRQIILDFAARHWL